MNGDNITKIGGSQSEKVGRVWRRENSLTDSGFWGEIADVGGPLMTRDNGFVEIEKVLIGLSRWETKVPGPVGLLLMQCA